MCLAADASYSQHVSPSTPPIECPDMQCPCLQPTELPTAIQTSLSMKATTGARSPVCATAALSHTHQVLPSILTVEAMDMMQ